jgi:hypothetical protein
MNSLEWWQLISENKCDGYSHSQEDDYNEVQKAFFNINGKTLNIQKTLTRKMKNQKVYDSNVEMKRQKSCGPQWGKLVQQLPEVVTFAYDLCFRHTIAHWKGLSEEYTSCCQTMTMSMV